KILADDLLVYGIGHFLEVALVGDEGVAGEVAGVLLHLNRNMGALPEILDFFSIFCREEIEEFAIEDIEEGGNVGVFLSLECDTADISFLDKMVIVLLLHAGNFNDFHAISYSPQ